MLQPSRLLFVHRIGFMLHPFILLFHLEQILKVMHLLEIILQGPVYKVLWCPFLADAFITCSADWSIRLWHQDKPAPVLTLLSAQVS